MMAQKSRMLVDISKCQSHFSVNLITFWSYTRIYWRTNQRTLYLYHRMKTASDWALTLCIALCSFENLSLYWLDQQRFVFLEFKTIDWFERAFFAIYYMIFQLIFSCIDELDKPFVSISTWSLSFHFGIYINQFLVSFLHTLHWKWLDDFSKLHYFAFKSICMRRTDFDIYTLHHTDTSLEISIVNFFIYLMLSHWTF